MPTLRPVRRGALIIWGVLLSVFAAVSTGILQATSTASSEAVVLLVPDNYQSDAVLVWQQAASEEGVILVVRTANEFLTAQLKRERPYAGIIVPDSIHRSGNDALTDSLRSYVAGGGKLMIVYDALTLNLNGVYPYANSRFSEVAGVKYALYEKYREKTIGRESLLASEKSVKQLGIVPGRYEIDDLRRLRKQEFDHWLTTYLYPQARYPFFRTEKPDPSAEVLLATADNHIVALQHDYGHGTALFVNLPLSLLSNATDGLLLHMFLTYFSENVVRLPRLLSVPNGIGGLILNVHVDNRDAIMHLDAMKRLGMLDQGPYSFHFTAGPDVDTVGDGRGMDLLHNHDAQVWIQTLRRQGHAIGNHGGWIHNYFGVNINDHNRADFEKYLRLNNDAMRSVLKRGILEYSAPLGNHPVWVTDWLRKHGILSYYTTANQGLGPTRTFIRGVLVDSHTWSMPISPMGRIASLEEAMFEGVPIEKVTTWLLAMVDFSVTRRNIREIYCHPIGIPLYGDSIRQLLLKTRELKNQGQFQWYTMTEAAEFMSVRERVAWHFERKDGNVRLRASHPKSLTGMTWRIQRTVCSQPKIVDGRGAVKADGGNWLVTAEDVRSLTLTCYRE